MFYVLCDNVLISLLMCVCRVIIKCYSLTYFGGKKAHRAYGTTTVTRRSQEEHRHTAECFAVIMRSRWSRQAHRRWPHGHDAASADDHLQRSKCVLYTD